jgi:hypothetical protein
MQLRRLAVAATKSSAARVVVVASTARTTTTTTAVSIGGRVLVVRPKRPTVLRPACCWFSSTTVSKNGNNNSTSDDLDLDLRTATESSSSSSTSSKRPQRHQRIWLAPPNDGSEQQLPYSYWTERIVDRVGSSANSPTSSNNNRPNVVLLKDVYRQAYSSLDGSSRHQHQQKKQLFQGVLHQDPSTDLELLCDNYTVKNIAAALRDREDALQYAAVLAADAVASGSSSSSSSSTTDQQQWNELAEHLSVYHPRFVLERRYAGSHKSRGVRSTTAVDGKTVEPPNKQPQADATQSLDRGNIELIRKGLSRMPRTITTAHSRRAAVVIALCTVDSVPCVLLEKRAAHLRTHADEVCLPGGMVCDVQDQSIVSTCLREMNEEIEGLFESGGDPDVLGVFRCNWGEIHHLVQVAVTPVVCSLGELPENLTPNKDEVALVFTVPLASLIDKSLWVHREGLAPIFVGGPEVIWGLSGYILERFAKDILMPICRPTTMPHSSQPQW